MKKNGLLITVLIAVFTAGGYLGYKYLLSHQKGCTLEARLCPDGTSVGRSGPNCEFSPCPTLKPENTPTVTQEGTVFGKLCYPSDFLPPGEIVAKDQISGKIYSQAYISTRSGGKTTYSLTLPTGTYHLRYQAHASTNKPEIFTSGYYDECAKTMAGTECTPDDGHINIDVAVAANQEIENIDLCDFYYNETQQKSLDQSF